MKKLILTALFLLSAPVLAEKMALEPNQKPVISQLQEGSVYKSQSKDEYNLVDPQMNIISKFKLNDGKDCTNLIDLVNKDPRLTKVVKVSEQQVKAQEKDSKIQHIFYCSNGVLVDIIH